MNWLFSHPLRSGLIAAGLLGCVATPLAAGPLPQPLAAAPSGNITLVRDSSAGDGPNRDNYQWRRHHGDWRGNNWRYGNRHWRHGNRHWRGDNWRYRHHYRHYRGSGLYFGLGVVPSYNYYVAPRRYYRSSSSAHVRWCYDRYRSYRAWDNSWQPYYGPRRQCRSPYD
jgi:hypothetical protein